MAEGRVLSPEPHEAPSARPLNPPRPWYRKPSWQITTVTLVGILAAAVLWWCPWCTVRVTDGSTPLADTLRTVQEMIHDENERVTGSRRPWVSIAVMLPIRTTDDARTKQGDALNHLQGAYVAQYWSNHPDGDEKKFGKDAPLIRILIADTGQDGQEWPDTVAQLVEMAHSDERLVAVAGLGLSTDATQQAVNALADEGISMVGSVITATELAAAGLFRVAPTNSDEAAVMIKYLESTQEWKSASAASPYQAYLVQDRAADDGYVRDLGNQYRRAFSNDGAHTLLQAQGDFDSLKEGSGNAIAAQIATICSIRPRVVFFAGRSDGLRTFLGALSARWCNGIPITVVSGDGVSNLNDPEGTASLWADGTNLEMIYTALASPETWKNYPSAASADTVNRFGQCRHCFTALFSARLTDGDAIMSHDSVLTAVRAARNVTSQQKPQPSADALINGLYQINASNPVPGASGWIYFQREGYLPNGVPYNKAVPIMRLHPDGTVSQVSLSSRSGTPPAGPQLPR
ncbi:MAG: ABC transporter substrate-binding protein [Acidobacteria bacterium]|nr:ABC transporter substrate-binding protein [Acidobacteriota bacterium]